MATNINIKQMNWSDYLRDTKTNDALIYIQDKNFYVQYVSNQYSQITFAQYYIVYGENGHDNSVLAILNRLQNTSPGLYLILENFEASEGVLYYYDGKSKWIAVDHGKPAYIHIAYADSPDGFENFSITDSANKSYMGQYTDFSEQPSINPSDYKWTRIKGEDGYTPIKGIDYFDGFTPVKGVDYFDGTDGSDGVSIAWQGTYATPPENPQDGWAYYNSNEKASYTYRDGSWYQMSVDGVNGQKGTSITWKGILEKPPTSPEENWAYKDQNDGKVYIYTGTGWELMVLDGNDGKDGMPGADGLSVFITYHDSNTKPSKPTGEGVDGGWHTEAWPESNWMSQKVAKNASEGEWSEPIKMTGQDTLSCYITSSAGTSFEENTTGTTIFRAYLYSGTEELDPTGAFKYTWYAQTSDGQQKVLTNASNIKPEDTTEQEFQNGKVIIVNLADVLGTTIFFEADDNDANNTSVLYLARLGMMVLNKSI